MVPGEEKALKHLQEKGFSVGASYLITEGIKKELNIDLYADLQYDYGQMRVIKEAMEDGRDISFIIGRDYSASQMVTVLNLQMDKLYDERAVDPSYTCNQMKAIAKSIKNKLDYTIFMKNSIAADYYNVVLPAIQLFGITDFSWIRSDMSDDFVQLIIEMMSANLYSHSLLILSEQELIRECERLKAEARDKDKFTKKNLSKFKVFSDLK